MFIKQPALRHFAVLGRTKKTRFGSIWEVKDRKAPDTNQFLFTPNSVRAWPRWVALLGDTCSPTRLRNGKVALLLNKDCTLEDLLPAFQRPNGVGIFVLKPMFGFEKRNRRWQTWLIPLCVCLVALCGYSLLPLNQSTSVALQRREISNPKKPIECKQAVLFGADLPKTAKPHSNLVVAGVSFRVLSVATFGGLTQLQLRRNCDNQKFTVAAWKSGDLLRVSKVN